MAPELLTGEAALQAICFKSQLSLARNVAGLPFASAKEPNATTLTQVQRWSHILQHHFGFEDVTADATLKAQGVRIYDFTPTEERTAAYRLLRLTCVLNQKPYTLWCELMTENHFTFSTTIHTLDFEEQLRVLEALADEVATHIRFAYDMRWGYLTAEPTRTGSGLQICSWVHLLGLKLSDAIQQTLNAAEVKGVFGEKAMLYESGTSEFYIFCNRFSINLPPHQIVRDYKTFLLRLAQQEIKARYRLAYDNTAAFYDLLNRTRLLCQQACVQPPEECINFLSAYWTACTVGAFIPLHSECYDFTTCFDDLADECCQEKLRSFLREEDIQALPKLFQKMFEKNDADVLRALWLRSLGEVTFSPDFIKRIQQ
ncbi:MAG: hypothetical protein IJV69_00970 [Kiritimatiellae bacterium]|nr:hypothetical protein [Kiritimatiellia bacterium]